MRRSLALGILACFGAAAACSSFGGGDSAISPSEAGVDASVADGASSSEASSGADASPTDSGSGPTDGGPGAWADAAAPIVCSDLRDAAAYDAGAQIFFCNDFDQGPEDPYVIDGGASAQRVGGRWASAPYSLAVSGPGVARFALASSPASWAIEVDVWLDGSLPAGTAFAMVTDSIAFSTVTFVTAPGGVGLRGLSAATFLVPPGWVHLRVETQPTTPTNTTTVYVDGQPFVLPLPIISSPSLFLGTPEAGAPVYYDDAVGKRAN